MQYNIENTPSTMGCDFLEDAVLKDNDWNFIYSESFSKTMEMLRKVQLPASALAMSDAWKLAVPTFKIDGAYAALGEIAARHKEWQNLIVQTDSLAAVAQSVLAATRVDTINLAASALELIDTSTLASLRNTASMAAALAKADWSWLSQVYAEGAEMKKISAPATTAVTDEIRAEMAEDIKQIVSDPEAMSVASKSKYLEWKARNPGLAAFFIEILFPILLLFADWGNNYWQARTTTDARVYEEPAATSNVVYNITVENNVTVIGDVPYYYEVEFINPETGEPMIGYVYKGNLVADESEETAAQEEVPEVTENREEAPEATELPETVPVATEAQVVALE